MIKIEGKEINSKKFPEFTWNADLIYYDGPLLSLYSRERGNDALFLWIDSDNYNNRWAVIDIERDDLKSYLNGVLALRDVINKTNTCHIFNTGPRGKRGKIIELKTEDFPNEYLPDPDSFLYREISTAAAKKLNTENLQAYDLKLAGEDIYIEDLGLISKLYQQLYSFHYGLDNLDREAVRNKLSSAMKKWTGGFSAVNLFSGLKNLTPSIHRARVKQLQYNSPGFIKLNALPSITAEISKTTELFIKNFEETETLYKDCYQYFREEKISGFDKENTEEKIELNETQKIIINEYLDNFFLKLDLENYKSNFVTLEIDSLGQIRTILAYYRRLRGLKKYIDEGTLTIP